MIPSWSLPSGTTVSFCRFVLSKYSQETMAVWYTISTWNSDYLVNIYPVSLVLHNKYLPCFQGQRHLCYSYQENAVICNVHYITRYFDYTGKSIQVITHTLIIQQTRSSALFCSSFTINFRYHTFNYILNEACFSSITARTNIKYLCKYSTYKIVPLKYIFSFYPCKTSKHILCEFFYDGIWELKC